ncbi:restriction endonuclease subunit S [Vibrio vulnificus]|uniref:restriction endonuclease subunit S n=1 Tax=Vibrio vulnificus TaxID=672 RepID=UPI003EDAF413
MSWPMVRLGDVCAITMGQAPKGDTYNDEGNGVALIAGAGDFGLLTPQPKKYTTAANKLSKVGDLILCIRATIGDLNWSDEEYCLGRGVAGLRPNLELDKNYLWYFITANKQELAAKGTGSTFKQVSRSIVEDWQIPLPPLDEQKRIAAILDKADAIRQKRKQAIALADEFLRSVFLEMFGDPVTNPKGWEVKPLSELIIKGDKINYGIVQPGDHVEDGIPIVRVGDIKDGSIDKSKLKRVARSIDEKHSKSRLVGDEILITCVGATVGKVALADAGLSGFNTVRALTRVRLNQEVNRSFVFRYLQSPFIQGYFQSQLRTVGQPTLNGKQIGETPILLPDLNMQREFLQLSDRALTIKDLSNSQLIEADNIFNALSQKAFSGQL